MKRLLRTSAMVLLWLGVPAWAPAEPVASLQPTNYVNDFAGVVNAATQAQLNELCHQVEQKAKSQIAVVTVKSLDGQDVESYALALYKKWGIGEKKTDRGVLILLAIQDHKRFIQTGYGLEPILPDGLVGGFGREAVPLLQSGNYSAAVTLLTTRVASVIAQDAGVTLDNQPSVAMPRRQQGPGVGAVVVLLLILFFVVIPLVRAIFRGGGGGPGGGSGFWTGLLGGMLLNSMGGGRGGFGGGGFGGGGFGGGGGGGFGGFGGGSTGGGGAGGSW